MKGFFLFCLLQVTVGVVVEFLLTIAPVAITGPLRLVRRESLLVYGFSIVKPMPMPTPLRAASPSVVSKYLQAALFSYLCHYKEWLISRVSKVTTFGSVMCKFSSLPVE